MGQRSKRIIRAREHEAPKRERCHRHRCKSTRRSRETCSLWIGQRHKKRALRSECRTMCPMRHQKTGKAMSHQHGRRRTGLHGNIQRANPIVADRTVPIAKIHALPLGMAQFPQRLPMLRPRVAKTGKDQNRNVILQAEPSQARYGKTIMARELFDGPLVWDSGNHSRRESRSTERTSTEAWSTP